MTGPRAAGADPSWFARQEAVTSANDPKPACPTWCRYRYLALSRWSKAVVLKTNFYYNSCVDSVLPSCVWSAGRPRECSFHTQEPSTQDEYRYEMRRDDIWKAPLARLSLDDVRFVYRQNGAHEWYRLFRFVTIMVVSAAMALGLAHALELPGKLRVARGGLLLNHAGVAG